MIALKRDRLGSVFYSVLDLAPAFPNVPYRRHGRERETNRASSFSPFCLFHHLPSGGVTSRRRPAPQLYTRDWVVSAVFPWRNQHPTTENKKRNKIKGIVHFQASLRPCQPTRKKKEKGNYIYLLLALADFLYHSSHQPQEALFHRPATHHNNRARRPCKPVGFCSQVKSSCYRLANQSCFFVVSVNGRQKFRISFPAWAWRRSCINVYMS